MPLNLIKINKTITLIESFNYDCQDWLEYSLHAYGDELIYRSGIEALANKYHIFVEKSFDGKESNRLVQEIDKIITHGYINNFILKNSKNRKR